MIKNLSEKEENLENTLGHQKEESGIIEFLHNFIKELGDYLNNMSNMKENTFVVDRIENNVAVCENRDTGKMVEIPVEKLPQEIKDGTVITEKNGHYEINKEKQKEIGKYWKEVGNMVILNKLFVFIK